MVHFDNMNCFCPCHHSSSVHDTCLDYVLYYDLSIVVALGHMAFAGHTDMAESFDVSDCVVVLIVVLLIVMMWLTVLMC